MSRSRIAAARSGLRQADKTIGPQYLHRCCHLETVGSASSRWSANCSAAQRAARVARRNGNDLSHAGAALIDLVKGISKGKVKLTHRPGQAEGLHPQAPGEACDLLGKRQAIVDSFKGMTSSIFAADLSVGEGEAPTIQPVLDAGAAGRQKAQALSGNVQALIVRGSPRPPSRVDGCGRGGPGADPSAGRGHE